MEGAIYPIEGSPDIIEYKYDDFCSRISDETT